MWAAIKRFFGYGQPETETVVHPVPVQKRETLPEVGDIPPMPSGIPPAPKPMQKKRVVDRKKYYRKGGEYYDIYDDSLILDMELVFILMDLFTPEDDRDHPDYVEEIIIDNEQYDSDEIAITAVEPEIEADTTEADIDAAAEAVAASMPDPEPYTPPAPEPAPVIETEPTYNSYSGGSSYVGNDNAYSGGSSYSGGSDTDSSSSSDSGGSDTDSSSSSDSGGGGGGSDD